MASRNYCFTSYLVPTPDKEFIQYMIYQMEKCPTTQKEHYQGYVEFTKPFKMAGVKKLFKDNTIHLEKRRGTQQQAIDYCRKLQSRMGEPVQFGDPAKQGKRNDLQEVVDRIQKKRPLREIVEECTSQYIKYSRGIEKAMAILSDVPVFQKITVYYIWGFPGTGKTRACYEYDSDLYRALKMEAHTTPWFDNYTGQKTILFDDYRGGYRYDLFLELLDGYKMQLQVKGGTTIKNWNTVLITSNLSIDQLYPKRGLSPELKRRITKIIQCKEGDTYSDIRGQMYDASPVTPNGSQEFDWETQKVIVLKDKK